MVKGNRRQWWKLRIFALVLILGSFAFTVLAITQFTLNRTAGKTWSWFWLFALLPGIVGVSNHIVTFRQRSAGDDGSEETQEETESQHRPRLGEAVAAASVLTGIFLVVAKAPTSAPEWEGLVYAGYGAISALCGSCSSVSTPMPSRLAS